MLVFILIMEKDTIEIPKEILDEMYQAHYEITRILETLEILMDKETLRRIKHSIGEINRGEYVDANVDEIDELLI
ncbi:hypothetical protein B6U81_05915 [Thermoplasmatales archaeon ex4484_30]|nr:MAG: hypothetical protein B6U81_05915 [Thermoplasmatales archaeon ex4484_30]